MTVTSSVPDADPGEARRRMRRQIRPPRARESGLGVISSRSGTRPQKPANHYRNLAVNELRQIKLFLEQVGVTFYTYRYYDPLTGRWPSKDPIEERGGLNLYGFVLNAPVYCFDVSGLYASSLTGLTPAELLALGVLGGGVATIPLVVNPPSLPDINIPDIRPTPKPRPAPKPEPPPSPQPTPVPPPIPPPSPPEPDEEEPNCCKPCTPAADKEYYYSAEKGTDRTNGRHAPTPKNPNGINQVKYWIVNQIPYSDTNPKACQCFVAFSHSDDNTLVPMPGPKYHQGPPPAFSGPLLGGGKLR